MSFAWPALFPFGHLLAIGFVIITIIDLVLVFRVNDPLKCERQVSKLLSLGSINTIKLLVFNNSRSSWRVQVIEELPYQLQIRDHFFYFRLKSNEKNEILYEITPKVRGAYAFGKVHTLIETPAGLIKRRITHDLDSEVPVYPSIIEMKKYELMSISRIATMTGIKRIRRLGHSYEFEQIKNYVKGDDYQSINWKATSRMNDLMVNHYEDEKSQQVFTIIDKSRAMKMPFNGLSLLDYAINTSLVISNTALNKQDKVGMISFSNKIDTALKADKHRMQLKKILENLYREQESSMEANYELLYRMIRNMIKGRSLIFLFTNFENLHALHRSLNVLRKISKAHLLAVVVFENTEIMEYSKKEAGTMKEVYFTTIARKFSSEKQQIVKELNQYGIQTILSKPEDLSISTINKYLELKSRGMI
jgi:uncharacterized protein (DUF58 family)